MKSSLSSPLFHRHSVILHLIFLIFFSESESLANLFLSISFFCFFLDRFSIFFPSILLSPRFFTHQCCKQFADEWWNYCYYKRSTEYIVFLLELVLMPVRVHTVISSLFHRVFSQIEWRHHQCHFYSSEWKWHFDHYKDKNHTFWQFRGRFVLFQSILMTFYF